MILGNAIAGLRGIALVPDMDLAPTTLPPAQSFEHCPCALFPEPLTRGFHFQVSLIR